MKSKTDRLSEILNTAIGKSGKRYTTALIAAAGSSTRMGGTISKQLMTIHDIPVIAYTLLAYQQAQTIDDIVLIARREDFDALIAVAKEYRIAKLRRVTEGGLSRQESVRRGLAVISPKTKYVAIADGARCLITPEQIDLVNHTAYRTGAASAATKAIDSVKIADAAGIIQSSPDRSTVWMAQTPQTFAVNLYRAAAYVALEKGWEATDDNSLVEKINHKVCLVDCGTENIKVTSQIDLYLARAILEKRADDKKISDESKGEKQ